MPWRLVLVLIGGCGRIGFDALGEVRTDAPGAADAADAAELGPFSPAVEVVELNQGAINSEDPSLTDDLLEVVFASTRAGGVGGVDIWSSTRASAAAPWGAPVLASTINSTSEEAAPEISGDGLTLVLASNRPGGAGLYDLYLATRASRGAAWSAPALITELASSADEFSGSINSGRTRLVFVSSRPGGSGAADIYEASRASSSAIWGTPVALPINSMADDSAAWMSGDGRTLYFGSTRAGGQGMGDIWNASRPSLGAGWTTPMAVTELNSVNLDSDPWLSLDQRTIVFSRQISSMRSIFTATR